MLGALSSLPEGQVQQNSVLPRKCCRKKKKKGKIKDGRNSKGLEKDKYLKIGQEAMKRSPDKTWTSFLLSFWNKIGGKS